MIKKSGTILINKRKIGLVYRSNHDDYSFPKGHQEEGETSLECAIRETNEETKREVSLLMNEPLYVEYYKDNKGNLCSCVYYLVCDNGKSDNDSEDTHDLLWVDYDKVEDVLTYDSLKKMWRIIKEVVKDYIED